MINGILHQEINHSGRCDFMTDLLVSLDSFETLSFFVLFDETLKFTLIAHIALTSKAPNDDREDGLRDVLNFHARTRHLY